MSYFIYFNFIISNANIKSKLVNYIPTSIRRQNLNPRPVGSKSWHSIPTYYLIAKNLFKVFVWIETNKNSGTYFEFDHKNFLWIFFSFQGYSRFQLKLGGSLSDDINRIRMCRSVLGPNDVLVGDANTGKITSIFGQSKFEQSKFWQLSHSTIYPVQF